MSKVSAGNPTGAKFPWLVLTVTLITFAVLALRAVDRDLNHDEHQFLAPAALTGETGLLPYRDYPLFHLPNLVFVYAWLAGITGELILSAKLLGALASTLLVGLVVALNVAGSGENRTRVFLGTAGLVLMLLCDPLFLFTAGKTWNHEVPTALLALALVFHVKAFSGRRALWLALSALAAGLAVGCRLTFALVLLPLVGVILLFPGSIPQRLRWAGWFTGWATLAMTPSLFLLFTSPEGFLFGNFEFPRLPRFDPAETRIHKTMSPWRKLRFFFKDVARPSWPIFLAFAAFGVRPAVIWWRQRNTQGVGSFVVLLTIPFLLAGCFAPSRYQYQHFFTIVPILVLGIAFGASSQLCYRGALRREMVLAGLGIYSCMAVVYTSFHDPGNAVEWIANARRPAEWFPNRAKRVGSAIREQVGTGRILTLAPTWAVAGGLDVYPELSTGVFGWRYAFLVERERRKRLHLLAPEDLGAMLGDRPPAGILTGVEEEQFEAPLIEYARAHGYQEVRLSRKQRLWVPRELAKP